MVEKEVWVENMRTLAWIFFGLNAFIFRYDVANNLFDGLTVMSGVVAIACLAAAIYGKFDLYD
jgi:hypothetical protein